MQAAEKPLVSVWWQQRLTRGLNRTFDCAIAGLLIAITLPLLAFVALAIKVESPGPVLIREPRLMRSGGRVQLFRFRVHRSRKYRGSMGPWRREATRTGRFLTYTCIRELPQLLNVLRGEWSLVDPHAKRSDFFG
jgi:lipopolysaccharide/colanic/teichoic acid biosynthesis glycosyltransferase